MKKKYILHFLFLCSFPVFSFCQEKNISYGVEMFGSLSTGDHTSFWMLYQNWGMVPLEATNGYLRGSIFYTQNLNKEWNCNLGLDIAASSPHSYNHNFWIQQLFGEVNWRFIQLRIGSKEDYKSFLDEKLSSGDFVVSNNSRPTPEIKISIPDFILVPYTKGNFYIKGDFSIGKFMDGKWQEETASLYNRTYTKHVLSHYKSIFFRLGNIERKQKMQFIFGMNHQAQWGGSIYKYSNGEYKEEKQPHSFNDFLRVFIAKEGGSNASWSDQMYVAGSHWGSYTFKFDYKLINENKLSAYIHHFFEDGSGMAFENYKDNILGIQYLSTQKQLFSNIVFEYIYTKHQTGAIHFNIAMDEEHSHLQSKGNGNDNYYNNVDYLQGPSYYGRTMGTPLFLSPEYNKDGRLNFKSNRIIAFHMGLEGYFNSALSYRLLATTGETWGRYYVPFVKSKKGIASIFDLIYDYNSNKIKDLKLKLTLAFNKGEFFDKDTWSAGFTITKTGFLSIK